MSAAPRAAVIGAGRIGRHHAKWYHRAGCELVGFTVSHPDHIAARAESLAADCPNPGQGYADVAALLDEQKPDLVSVCTPAGAHAEPARMALERGIPVLCEKPLVWHDDPHEALRLAGELVDLATERGTLLAVNLQYTFAADAYRDLAGHVSGPERCEVVLESRGKGAPRTPSEVWMELGPHALSLAFALLPRAEFDPETMSVRAHDSTAAAAFDLRDRGMRVLTTVKCGQRMDGDLTRHFGLNGRLVSYAGRNNAAGEYCTYLTLGSVEREYPDLMRDSIERFVRAATGAAKGGVVDGETALRNLTAQVRVAEALAEHESAGSESEADG